MKMMFCVFLCLHVCTLCSQSDSTYRQLKGMQVEVSTAPWIMMVPTSQAQLQTFLPDNIFLRRDLTGYTKQNVVFGSGYNFTGMAGVKFFLFEKQHLETFAGVRYGQAFLTGVMYTRSVEDFISSFIEPGTGQQIIVVNREEYSMSYSVVADRIYVPLGINFFTRQKRLFWLSGGVELCPLLNFNYRFKAMLNYSRWVESVRPGEQKSGFSSIAEDRGWYTNSQNIDGLSAGGYVGLPFALHLHPFTKNRRAPGRLHALVTLMPAYAFNSSRFGKIVSDFTVIANVGIRYNFL